MVGGWLMESKVGMKDGGKSKRQSAAYSTKRGSWTLRSCQDAKTPRGLDKSITGLIKDPLRSFSL